MNILLVSEVSAEKIVGGAERVLRSQALGLAALGHRVQLLTRSSGQAQGDMIRMGDVREWRYSVNRAHEAAFLWSSLRRSVERFDQLRLTEPFDAVIIHQAMAGLGLILSRRHAASRWIYLCHSLSHEVYDEREAPAHSMLTGLRRRANLQGRCSVERTVMSRCQRVVVLSQFMRQRVMRAHGISADRLVVVPGAVDPEAFVPAQDQHTAKVALNLPTDRMILFTVRNLVPRMGLENLLNAVEMLGPVSHKWLLVIGGEGPLRERLQAEIRRKGLRDTVQLIGFIPEEKLHHYYQAADLVLMPSLQLEGCGLVIVEALACGTPVLGTPVGVIPEILNQVDPLLVTQGTDGPSLARALERVVKRIGEPGERARLAHKGRAVIQRRYNWTHHCSELVDVMDRPLSLTTAA